MSDYRTSDREPSRLVLRLRPRKLIVRLAHMLEHHSPGGFVFDLRLIRHHLPDVSEDAAPATIGRAHVSWSNCPVTQQDSESFEPFQILAVTFRLELSPRSFNPPLKPGPLGAEAFERLVKDVDDG